VITHQAITTVKSPQGSGDATASVTAALFGLDGFSVLAAAEAGGELELLVETTADLVACPECGAVARAKGSVPDVGARFADRRAAGGDLLAQAHLVLPSYGVPGQDLDGGTSGDRAAGAFDRAGPSLGVRADGAVRCGGVAGGHAVGSGLVDDQLDRGVLTGREQL
jgi:hypothetical protein